jgi:hypothetical protein
MDAYDKNAENSFEKDLDQAVPEAGRPVSFDVLIFRLAPLLISLDAEDMELIKMAYLTAIRNDMVIDNKLLIEALRISERTLLNRKNKIIGKINTALGISHNSGTSAC